MPPPKITGEKINCRVKLGSALERVLQGRDVTETLHRMAELIEAAPPTVMAELPIQERFWEQVDMQQLVEIGTGRDAQVVPLSEALALAAQQAPAGLQVVGLDEGEVFEDEMTTAEAEEIIKTEEMFDPTGTEREAHELEVYEQMSGGTSETDVGEDVQGTSETDVPLATVEAGPDLSHLV